MSPGNFNVPNPRTGPARHLPNVSFARDLPVRQPPCSLAGSSPLSHFTPNRRISNKPSATSLIQKVERPLLVRASTALLPVVPTLSRKHLFLLGERQATPQAHASQQRGGAEGGVRWEGRVSQASTFGHHLRRKSHEISSSCESCLKTLAVTTPSTLAGQTPGSRGKLSPSRIPSHSHSRAVPVPAPWQRRSGFL